jgi:hypothetical protein
MSDELAREVLSESSTAVPRVLSITSGPSPTSAAAPAPTAGSTKPTIEAGKRDLTSTPRGITPTRRLSRDRLIDAAAGFRARGGPRSRIRTSSRRRGWYRWCVWPGAELTALIRRHVDLGCSAGVNPVGEAMSLIAAMCAGADCIDDAGHRRAPGARRSGPRRGRARASGVAVPELPATPGAGASASLLRAAFAGAVSQLDALRAVGIWSCALHQPRVVREDDELRAVAGAEFGHRV